MTRFNLHFLDLLGIVLFLGGGGFLLRDSITQTSQSGEVILGSALVSLGLILAIFEARFLFKVFAEGSNTRRETTHIK